MPIHAAKEVPLCATFGVDVVLHVEVVNGEELVGVLEGHEEVAALEGAVEG